MNEKVKTRLYLVIGLAGIVLVLVSKFIIADLTSAFISRALICVGFGIFGIGITKWCFGIWNEKNPELMKEYEIEANDERNQLIKIKAQAVCGEILRWMLMGAAWVCIVMDFPIWIAVALVCVFLLKNALELILMAYYQRKM